MPELPLSQLTRRGGLAETKRIGEYRMRQTILKSTLLITLGLVAGRLSDLKPVKAQSSCSARSLSGSYTYSLNGSYFASDNNNYGYSAVGQFTADGNGNLSGSETTDDGATIYTNDTVTGTYMVNGDCSGSATFNLAQDQPINVNFVLTNAGKNIYLIETDDGTQTVGQATTQFQ